MQADRKRQIIERLQRLDSDREIGHNGSSEATADVPGISYALHQDRCSHCHAVPRGMHCIGQCATAHCHAPHRSVVPQCHVLRRTVLCCTLRGCWHFVSCSGHAVREGPEHICAEHYGA